MTGGGQRSEQRTGLTRELRGHETGYCAMANSREVAKDTFSGGLTKAGNERTWAGPWAWAGRRREKRGKSARRVRASTEKVEGKGHFRGKATTIAPLFSISHRAPEARLTRTVRPIRPSLFLAFVLYLGTVAVRSGFFPVVPEKRGNLADDDLHECVKAVCLRR